jgi:hypothetical protein
MRSRIKRRPAVQRIAIGAVAGLGATGVMQGLLTASAKLLPESKPPMKADPGKFMAEKAHVPEQLQKAAAKSLQMGYGMTSGMLYAAVRPRGGSILIDGTLLGVAVWAAGYLGWLPAADLMPPVTEHTAQQVTVPIVNHALFGIAVVAAYDGMMRL